MSLSGATQPASRSSTLKIEDKVFCIMLEEIAKSFVIQGALLSIRPIEAGHINETYLSEWKTDAGVARFIHQRINHLIFKDVPRLMENVRIITEHIAKRQELGTVAAGDEGLRIIPTKLRDSYLRTTEGTYWRTYNYIEGSETFNVCPDPEHAYEAAKTFGRFLGYLSDIDVGRLCETIPRFQDTSFRYEQLDDALMNDAKKRVAQVEPELEFCLSRRSVGLLIMDALRTGAVPLRVSHSDPKVNNVLFKQKTGKGFCIVDLDTCMPGTVLYDFGDLVRSASVSAAEDEVDLSKVAMSQEYFSALAKGFVESFGPQMSEREFELLAFAPRIIALTLGVRFLTDYLNGDVYFRIHRERQNLDRARAQFQIARDMEQREAFMQEVVASARNSIR